MDPQQIKRRFGPTLHDICQWAYASLNSSTEGALLQRDLFGQECDFPWASFMSPEKPEVCRHLDYPVTEWDQMSPLLSSDLDRLCHLENFHDGERVVSLEWRIVFQDLTYLVIPIHFRHPHSLHQEITRQHTALLQALYAFESSLRGSPLDPQRLDELIPIEPVISWTLTIAERLVLPDQLAGLFAGHDTHAYAQQALLEMENRLPVALEAYDLRHDPLPEDSFASLTKEDPYEMDVKAFPTLAAQAQKRPLFLFREPFLLEERWPAGAFTERTLDKWWRTNSGGSERPLQRDYYRVIARDQKALWVFRDNKNAESYFVHGVFA
jgi:hypothetical protein